MPPNPFRRQLAPRVGFGENRLTVEPTFEVARQRAGRRIPPRGLPLHRLETNGGQILFDGAIDGTRRDRVFFGHATEGLDRRRRHEGRATRQAAVKDGAQAVDVGRGGELTAWACRLFRGHVGRSAHDGAGQSQVVAVGQSFGQSEVRGPEARPRRR